MLINPVAVRTLRERTGFTLSGYAEAAGIAKSYLHEIENTNGPKRVSPRIAKSLATALHVPLTAILVSQEDAA